jgi:proteasome beta subunit
LSEAAIEYKNLKGTTTVGLLFEKGIVLAADKRATMGSYIASKEVEKIHLLGDRIALTLAGGVGDAQSLVRLMRAELELYRYSRGEDITVEGAATLLANILQGSKYYPYFVQLLIAGVDTAPRLYDLDLLGGLLPEKYTSTGSGSVVAIGLLDEGWREGLTEADATRLAARSVQAAMRRENNTGDGVDVLVVTRDKAKRLSREEVARLLA